MLELTTLLSSQSVMWCNKNDVNSKMITIKDMIETPPDNKPIIGNNVSTLKPTEIVFY